MQKNYQTLKLDNHDGIVSITFNREKDTNAFSRVMTLEVIEICQLIQSNDLFDQVEALILTGGTGRSFSVGGDFNDVSQLEEEQEIRAYLGEIIDLYIEILRLDVPVIAAIDHFAIGQGLQVALMTDWRVGSERCQLQMPELKNGVACPLGSIILEYLLGRAKMLEFVMDCGFIDADASREHGLLNQIASVDNLQASAQAMAGKLKDYPAASFTATKRIHNQRYIDAIESVREASSRAHVAAFLQKAGKQHFDKILGRSN